MLYEASAPGSLMLFGEHAVLHGGTAISVAINSRIHVKIKQREDNLCNVDSQRFGSFSFSIAELPTLPTLNSYKFVIASIQELLSFSNFNVDNVKGFNLEIYSEFADNLGLGSSAAIVVATIKAFALFLNVDINRSEIFKLSVASVRKVQGIGSGADVAASTFGGLVKLKNDIAIPLAIKKPINIIVIYSGYKTPTTEVIAHVKSKSKAYPDLYDSLYSSIDSATRAALPFINSGDMQKVGELMNVSNFLMSALGVNDYALDTIQCELSSNENIFGAKISGSGLGDCVIALSTKEFKVNISLPLARQLPVTIDEQGVLVNEPTRVCQ